MSCHLFCTKIEGEIVLPLKIIVMPLVNHGVILVVGNLDFFMLSVYPVLLRVRQPLSANAVGTDKDCNP